MNQHLEQLEPNIVWKHFKTLCDIPRPSYHEAQLRDYLVNWAKLRSLTTYIDPCGNLLIRKPATKGMEDRETTVLQGHLDMVAQKNENTEHDFTKDSITTEIIDGWVTAKGTTLGADNGIGVAAALAVLEDNSIQHGPLEVLFTIEEETSLRGATELEEGILTGRLLLNLDSEDRGDVYVGCAGGVDINIRQVYQSIEVTDDKECYELFISGLRGGHSGLDIHKGRASANVLLSRFLLALSDSFSFQLAELNGGTLRNAIAREARAKLFIVVDDAEQIKNFIELLEQQVREEYQSVERDFCVEFRQSQQTSRRALLLENQISLIRALRCAPHGVNRMSSELEGVTETSCNFGVVNLTLDEDALIFSSCFLVRSLIDAAILDVANTVRANFAQIDAQVSMDNHYPGWKPDPTAGLLSYFLRTHKDVMGYDANIKVIHAGLECGIIGAKYKEMEMVSFGPNIRGAHSPDERLEIDSVADFWRLLVSLLAHVPLKAS